MKPPTTLGDRALGLDLRRAIDAACDRFEAAWLADPGAAPDLDAFLPAPGDPGRAPAFRELLALDLDYRRDRGESPAPDDYRARFPEYDAILAALVPASAGDGPTIVARRPSADDDDDEVSVWVETTIENPASGRPRSVPGLGDDDRDALREAGYDVLDQLGRGGMGVVFLARQVQLNRQVALKVIRSGSFASTAELRRFQNEAEAVATLDHPGIVPIFEVGRARGRHFFSMKLVVGSALDRRLGDFAANPRAAARLVAEVADAVHHAHQRGVLHRDLKPANILLDEDDRPHVTDFGLAKRVAADGELTHTGAILGTPSYMAPEQASGRRGAMTVATDVYGLGTILYALLAGHGPFSGSTSVVETLDKVREEAPEPPSRANPRVPRDLEVICLKCLEKDPRRRFADARSLADDLRRWLDGRSIAARPVGPATRAALWCRRHPLPAALAAGLAVAVVVGLAGVSWKWAEAERRRATSEALSAYYAKLLRDAPPALIDLAALGVGKDFQGQPAVEAALRETIGAAYLSNGLADRAEPHLRRAVELDRALFGRDARATLAAEVELDDAIGRNGRATEAEPALRRALDACRRALGPADAVTLRAAQGLGLLLRRAGRLDEAEALLRRNLDDRRRALGEGADDSLRSMTDLCRLLIDRSKYEDADTLAHAYGLAVQCHRGLKHPDNVTALANLALLRRRQGRVAEADRLDRDAADAARRLLGPDHPTTLALTRRLPRPPPNSRR